MPTQTATLYIQYVANDSWEQGANHPQVYIANFFGQAAFISIHFPAHDSALNVYMDLNN